MLRGIITGFIWGAIVGFGIIVVANAVVAPVEISQPLPNVTADTQADTLEPAPQEDAAPDVQADAASADPDRAAMGADEPKATDAAAGDTPADGADSAAAPAAQGETASPDQPDATAPETQTQPAEVAVGEAPVLPTPQAAEPMMPNADSPVAPDTPPVNNAMGTAVEAADGTPADGTPKEPMIGEQVTSFTEREDSRKSTRLPTVAPQADAAAGADAPIVVAEDLPALVANSADFNGEVAGPMLSIVLVDIAQLGPEDAAIQNLPFPVTFGVDVLATEAGARAQAYRDSGLEVLAMVGLPDGAQVTDVATTLAQAREIMPVSMGFLDVPASSYQASRQIAAQVVATAKESGHGLLTFPRGLNALEQEAQSESQPAITVFRDIDGRGQDVAAIKRFLDQAAFRAGIDGGLVLLGRSTNETIQALAEWALGNRAATVSLVPLSHLLTARQERG